MSEDIQKTMGKCTKNRENEKKNNKPIICSKTSIQIYGRYRGKCKKHRENEKKNNKSIICSMTNIYQDLHMCQQCLFTLAQRNWLEHILKWGQRIMSRKAHISGIPVYVQKQMKLAFPGGKVADIRPTWPAWRMREYQE